MKFGLIVVAVAILSAIAAQALLADPGYVAISVRGYLFEMSVPVLVGAIVVLIVGLWLLRQLWLTPRRLGQAYGRGRADRAGKKLTAGMIEVAEGNYARGEKMLARAAGSARRSSTTCRRPAPRTCKAATSAATSGSSWPTTKHPKPPTRYC